MSRDYDVIVIGGGGAGFAAALSARERGASVLVVEAGDKPGGSSAMSGGVVYAAGTSVQKAAGITDSPDGMYEYYMTLSQWNLEPYLIRRMADESAPVVEWLIGLGVEFRPEKLYCAGVESIPRGHMTEGAGYALFQRLEQAAAARGVETVLRTRAEKLLVNDTGRVIGVRAGGADVHADAVVVACGGIGHNEALLQQHFPSVSMHGDWVFYFGGPHNQGDALTMGQAIGAAITGHDRGGPIVTPNFTHAVDAYLPGWLVLVNEEGRRFIDETAPYTVYDGLVNRQTNNHCFALLDEATRQWARPDPSITDPLQLGDTMAYNWVGDTIAKQAEQGRVHKGATVAELAARTGIRASTLQTTLDNYNRDVEKQTDSRFLKRFRPLRPISTPPFYAVELRAASYAVTGTGLRIDDEARVLNEADIPIEGLYAAGESAGGVYGDRYFAGGSSLGAALVWGRIAGRNAAQLARTSQR
ncbi:MAG: FAD-dependent oxidoreductase [Steroidobacteraceae bacterium]